MKKLHLLILVVSIVLLGVWIEGQIISQSDSKSSANSKLDYLFLIDGDISNLSFSLNVADSDWYAHECILNSLIGNLVKYNSSGKIEPYLAESFSVSEDGLIWTYLIREDQTCEDGTPINSKTFAETLKRQIFSYSKKTRPIDFDKLLGFDNFTKGELREFPGIQHDEKNVIFRFTKRPEDLNEMLRMPYFGFWCPANFNDNKGNLNGNFISSGPYKLSKQSSVKNIIVEKRAGWFSNTNSSFNEISFSYHSLKKPLPPNKAIILETNSQVDSEIFHNLGFSLIKGLPTLSANIILSPYKNGFFKDVQNRQAFLNRIREIQGSHSKYTSKFFYLNARSEVVENNLKFKQGSFFNEIIQIGSVSPKNPRSIYIENLLNEKFADVGLKFNINYPNGEASDWQNKVLSNREFDVRIGGVANGAQIRNFIVKMMFCSNLGVRYPDPSGKICSLVNEQDKNNGPISEQYIKTFNQILYDDAVVIPLYHTSFQWLVSNEISLDSFPPTVEHPLFENIRLK